MSTISKEAQIALLAAGSYWDIRQDDNLATPNIDEANRAPLPEGWKILTQFDKSDSGPAAVTGFSARVYQNISSGDIVISYAGTVFDEPHCSYRNHKTNQHVAVIDTAWNAIKFAVTRGVA